MLDIDQEKLLKDRIKWMKQKLEAQRHVGGPDHTENQLLIGRTQGEIGGLEWAFTSLKRLKSPALTKKRPKNQQIRLVIAPSQAVFRRWMTKMKETAEDLGLDIEFSSHNRLVIESVEEGYIDFIYVTEQEATYGYPAGVTLLILGKDWEHVKPALHALRGYMMTEYQNQRIHSVLTDDSV